MTRGIARVKCLVYFYMQYLHLYCYNLTVFLLSSSVYRMPVKSPWDTSCTRDWFHHHRPLPSNSIKIQDFNSTFSFRLVVILILLISSWNYFWKTTKIKCFNDCSKRQTTNPEKHLVTLKTLSHIAEIANSEKKIRRQWNWNPVRFINSRVNFGQRGTAVQSKQQEMKPQIYHLFHALKKHSSQTKDWLILTAATTTR